MIISIINQKGGVAKTTSVHNIATALSLKSERVLLIDLDPQASLTISLGIEPVTLESTIYNVLCEGTSSTNSIIKLADFDILPSTIDLSVADMMLAGKIAREFLLKKALASIQDNYDHILIDCPPSLGLLTINALTASDSLLIPVTTDYLALRGLELLFTTVKNIREDLNKELNIIGIIPTMYDSRTLHSQEVFEALKANHKDIVFEPISSSVQVKDAVLSKSCIVKDNPTHKISKVYKSIAEVIINGN